MQNIVKIHLAKKDSNLEYKKAKLESTANEYADELATNANKNVAVLFLQQQKLESLTKQLIQQTNSYMKHLQNWDSLFGEFNNSFKELGDIANWSQAIERDLTIISKCIELISNKS